MSLLSNEILFEKFEVISCYKKDENSAVYLANHIFLDKKVFLKILNTKTIPDPAITQRFKREAKILAQLEHPNIISVFDFGMFKEYFYISFEYFESRNLRELFTHQTVSEDTKRIIFIQLVKGLYFAHTKNVIHRDIKPENILVNDNYEVKLTDFGLAQDSLDNLITQQYSVVGTPAYMSPEQIQGEKVTIQSDLFSLGITAVEIFRGQNPFMGKDTNETISNIISFDETKRNDLFSGYSEDIENVLRGLLAVDLSKRFKSCSEIFNILNIENEQPRKEKTKNNKNYWLAAILFITISFLVWIFSEMVNQTKDENNYAENSMTETEKSFDNSKQNIENNGDLVSEIEEPVKIVKNKTQTEISNLSDKSINPPITAEQELEPISIKMGELQIKCYPWAKVFLNNKFIETTPLSKNISAKEGKYLLTLVHPDYPEYSDSIKIIGDELYFVEVNLNTLFGYLECQVYPWSEVYINGQKKGVTPFQKPIKLEEGNYRLKLVNPQYKEIETEIKILRKDTLKLKFNMVQSKPI